MGKKILITGGVGFIGRYLTKALLNKNYEITIVDNLFRWNLNNVEKLDIKFIEGNICDENLVSELIKENDLVVHLVGVSQVMTSIQNPDQCFRWNITGTKNIVKYCTEYHKKLIFSSSREVYGSADYLPVDLDHKPKPENPYSASKISGESLILSYGKNFNLNYVIFRLSNVYGYSDKGRVIPIFIERALKNQNLILFGNKKIIDFIYINDVILAFLEVIENNKVKNEIINIGSGKSTKLKELAKLVIKLTDSKSRIIIKPERIGEVDRFIAGIGETQKILKNWKPEIDLETGLKIMISNYKKYEKI